MSKMHQRAKSLVINPRSWITPPTSPPPGLAIPEKKTSIERVKSKLGHKRYLSLQAISALMGHGDRPRACCLSRASRCSLKVSVAVLWMLGLVVYLGLGNMVKKQRGFATAGHHKSIPHGLLRDMGLPHVGQMLDGYDVPRPPVNTSLLKSWIEPKVNMSQYWFGTTGHARRATNGSVMLVTAVTSPADISQLSNLLLSVKSYHSNLNVTVYLVCKLTDEQTIKVALQLQPFNGSLIHFDFKIFPSHVSVLEEQAYRPLILQDALYKFGTIVWVSASVQFTSADLAPIVSLSSKLGIAGVGMESPTSVATHYGMYKYFNVSQSDYYMHRMMDTRFIVLTPSPWLERRVMRPLVGCALLHRCILPLGASTRGCDYNKTPRFRYSDCHWLDAAALNVVLGVAFDFTTDYLYDGPEVVFFNDAKTKNKAQRARRKQKHRFS